MVWCQRTSSERRSLQHCSCGSPQAWDNNGQEAQPAQQKLEIERDAGGVIQSLGVQPHQKNPVAEIPGNVALRP